MSLVFSNLGDTLALGNLINKTANGNLHLHLNTNNYAPVKTSTVSNFTESTATGYSLATLTGASWVIATDGSNNTVATYPEVTFTYTAAESVYGYYVTDAADTTLVYAEQFGAVANVPSGGGSIKVTPTVQFN